MRHLLLLAFLFNVSCNGFTLSSCNEGAIQTPTDTLLTNRVPKFKAVLNGSGSTMEGVRFSFSVYNSEDGLTVTKRRERYESKEAANLSFSKYLDNANRVFEQTEESNKLGSLKVPRALFEKKKENSDIFEYTIIWVDGTIIDFIVADQKSTANEFEDFSYKSDLTLEHQ